MQIYNIEGLSCAACASSAQKVLSRRKGVTSVRVNYATKTTAVETEDATVDINFLNEGLQKLGFKLFPKNKDSYLLRKEREQAAFLKLKKQLFFAALFGFPLFLIAMFFSQIPFANYIMFGLTLPVILWSGSRFYISAFNQLSILKVNMDSLIALGTGAAFLFSSFNTFFPSVLLSRGIQPHVYFEAAGVLIVFVLLGKFLEAKAGKQTSSAIEELISLQPDTVQLLEDGIEKSMPLSVVSEGDHLKIRPGDYIPLDAQIMEGTAEIDESMLSGEVYPVSRSEGQQVCAGTITVQGSLIIKVTAIGEDTVLSQIIKMVEEAQNSQIPVQKTVDKIASVFVPLVILISLITFSVWFSLGLPTVGFVTAIAVLVVACPCALGLATPTAIMTGIGQAAKKGILISNAAAIEKSAKIDIVILDKTGTITEGLPEISSLIWQKEALGEEEKLQNILLSLENESEHPLAKAFLRKPGNSMLKMLNVNRFQNHPGKGISGIIDGEKYWVGNEKMMTEANLTTQKNVEKTKSGITYFASEKGIIALIKFNDAIKKSSRKAVESLQKSGKVVYMLTGDNESAAAYTAKNTGIKNYQSGLMPEDKIAFVKELQQKGKIVMMVGDGINDAPALAQADVGVAMNKGTSVAVASADVILRNNDLLQLQEISKTSSRMLLIIRQNLFWAFIYNILLLPLAAGVLYPFGILLNPMFAGAAMSVSSLLVVMNSLRLKQY